jgi:hypothetical protein
MRNRVPIYAASSWASLMSQSAAFYLDPIRDIYEVSSLGVPSYLGHLDPLTSFYDRHLRYTPFSSF